MTGDYEESTVPADVSHLTAAVEGGEIAPYLVVLTGASMGSIYCLNEQKIVIGRADECDITIEDESMSRAHVEVYRDSEGQYFIHDLESTNGTFKQGKRIDHATLNEGERFQVGATVFLRLTLADGVEDSFRQLYDASIRDALTGLYNRRHFADRYHSAYSYARRHGRAFSLIMLDIDFFKQINDSRGHMAGDQVLRKIAEILQGAVRAEDVVARYGGEEFIIMAPGVDGEGARLAAERVRALIESAQLIWGGESIRVTISAGVASLSAESKGAEQELIESADRALYAAKKAGRNRVAIN